MIVDRIENLVLYAGLHPALGVIAAFLGKGDPLKIPAGRRELSQDVGLIRESYLTRPASDCVFEGHRTHADLQLVLSGVESIGWLHRSLGKHSVAAPYDPAKDVEKYAVRDYSRVDLSAGMFALVFPDDLHMPKLMKEETARVEKAVFKIALQEDL